MKRIYLLCLMLCLTACGSETDTALGMDNQPPSVEIKEHAAYRYKVVLNNASADAVITINDLPSWAEFDPDPEANMITGIPGHDNADAEFTYSISVVDGEETFQSDDVTITVKHSNLQILSTPRPKALLTEFSSFSRTISVQSDIVLLTFSLLDAPDWMQIDSKTGEISGIPDHSYVGQTYNITTVVSDGFHERQLAPFELTVTPDNNLNPVITVATNADGDFYINQNIEIDFSQEIEDITTITLEAPNGACIANIQISEDDFSTCIELEALYPSPVYKDYVTDEDKTEEENEEAEAAERLEAEINAKRNAQLLLSTEKLELNKNYQVKVTTFVSEGFDYSLLADFESNFYPVSGLLITEVGGREHYDAQHWFEVYNATSSVIDLSNYELRTRAIDASTCAGSCIVDDDHRFALNTLNIQPGQYAIVRGQSWYSAYSDAERVTYIVDGQFYPYWDSKGFIELVKKSTETTLGETADFVVFGYWTEEELPIPITISESIGGSASALSYDTNTSYSKSLARRATLRDTNDSSDDWVNSSFNTPGGPNDVISSLDSDGDGLPDSAEVEGTTYAGISLYDLGARINQKDIFIEVDYMKSLDEGVIPREEALQKVVDAFMAQNIAVHFDVGDLFDQNSGINPEKFDLGGGNQVPFSLGVGFNVEDGDGLIDIYDIKRNNMNYARLPIFHYMLMAYSQNMDGSSGSSGIAEFNGNDLAITLGDWGLNSNYESDINKLINLQSATIMHELGHNLGLMHGGDDNNNYKPNYLSVMNYLYQLYGLPDLTNNAGDRYYHSINNRTGGCITQAVTMTNPYDGNYSDFKIDYSASATTFDEAIIYEIDGLNVTGSTAVDFDCDGDSTETLNDFNVNGSTGAIDQFHQESDWSNINLKFQNHFQGNSNGASLSSALQPTDLELIKDVVGDDIGQVIQESKPPQAFFDKLKSR